MNWSHIYVIFYRNYIKSGVVDNKIPFPKFENSKVHGM